MSRLTAGTVCDRFVHRAGKRELPVYLRSIPLRVENRQRVETRQAQVNRVEAVRRLRRETAAKSA